MRLVVQNRPHQRQSPRKGVVQLDHVRHTHVGKRGLHLLTGDPVVANEKADVFHVLRVVPPHHLSKYEINRVRSEERQVLRRRAQDRDDLLVPLGTEENEIFRKQVRDVKTSRFEKLICSFHRIPEFPIGIKFLKLTDPKDCVHILRCPMSLINPIEPKADCPPDRKEQAKPFPTILYQGWKESPTDCQKTYSSRSDIHWTNPLHHGFTTVSREACHCHKSCNVGQQVGPRCFKIGQQIQQFAPKRVIRLNPIS